MDNRSLSCAPKTYRKPVYASPPLRRLPYVLVLLRCDACKRAGSYQARAVGEVRGGDFAGRLAREAIGGLSVA